MRSANIRHMVA